MPSGDHWNSLARNALRYDVYEVLSKLSLDAVEVAAEIGLPSEAVAERRWTAPTQSIERARLVLQQAISVAPVQLSALSVAMRALRRVALAESGEGGSTMQRGGRAVEAGVKAPI